MSRGETLDMELQIMILNATYQFDSDIELLLKRDPREKMINRKKALGSDPLGWIKSTTREDKALESREELSSEGGSQPALNSRTSELRNFGIHTIKLTVTIGENHLEFLSKLERKIMKSRSMGNKKERITKNSILRAMVEACMSLDIEASEVGSEEELIKRFKKAVVPR